MKIKSDIAALSFEVNPRGSTYYKDNFSCSFEIF